MSIELRVLTAEHVEAHCAGEDEATVRWLTGGYGTIEGTRQYFDWLAENAAAGQGKRGFGVWVDSRLAGSVEFDPDTSDGIRPEDVNVTYAVHPWARGQGVAVQAVHLLCAYLQRNQIGERAAIRVDPANIASVNLAIKAGFHYVRNFKSDSDRHEDGSAATLALYVLDLQPDSTPGAKRESQSL